jgi:hypothetical protein
MGTRGSKPLSLRAGVRSKKFVKKSYYLDEPYAKAIVVLSILTGRPHSNLVNEAIGDLIKKYQPMTNIKLLKLESMLRKD